MFSHIMIGSNDIARSKKFYDALFAAMGAQPGTEDAQRPVGLFAQWRAFHGVQADRRQAGRACQRRHDRLFDRRCETGGSMAQSRRREWRHVDRGPARGAPNGAYLAYLRDPDGNKLVAVARPAS